MIIEIENAKTDGSNLAFGEEDIGYRIVTVDSKYKFHLRSKDPYGFISISTGVGQIPKELRGEFTSSSDAISAIRAYVNKKNTEENKLPRDKNTRKIKELLDASSAESPGN